MSSLKDNEWQELEIEFEAEIREFLSYQKQTALWRASAETATTRGEMKKESAMPGALIPVSQMVQQNWKIVLYFRATGMRRARLRGQIFISRRRFCL